MDYAASIEIQVLVALRLWEFESPRPHSKGPVFTGLFACLGRPDQPCNHLG
jgi:hypothetical protein